MKVLITGSAGFIGFFCAKKLLERGDEVVGVDNFNDYYDVSLKEGRNRILEGFVNFKSYRADFSDWEELGGIFKKENIDKICHLGAQAGVRYSLENPGAYERSNLKGTLNILEAARRFGVNDLVFASSSSVYGNNKNVPFSENDSVDNPVSLYAATKKANELMAATYRHLYGLNCTGLRFFTVIGPWGRPDMALFKFTKAISEGRPIPVYNHGRHKRDFTYIDDIVEGVVNALDRPLPFEIINLGNNRPVELSNFIGLIEKGLGRKAEKEMLPMQPGDVKETCADISKAERLLGFRPRVPVEDGVGRFISWYKEHY